MSSHPGGKKSDVDKAREVVEGIIALQTTMLREEQWLADEVSKSKGNVARMEVFSLDGAYSKTFELGDDMQIRPSKRPPIHVIRCHIDVLLDLMSGDVTMGDAYLEGLITFDGKDFHAHAWKWSRYFSKLQQYLSGKV